jgi:hypothetical protein
MSGGVEMARKRFVTSEISTDRKIAKLAEKNPVAAALWPWFITDLDDWGRMNADPVEVKLTIFPAFPYTSDEIEEFIRLYHEFEIAYFYEVEGKYYLAVNPDTWLKYQTYIRKDKLEKQKSKIPEPKDAPWVAKNDTNNDLATFIVAKQQSATENVLSPSPSPSPSKDIYICAPDGARAYTAPSPGGSVEASDEVAATLEDKPAEKSGPRSPFTSKRQEQLFDEFWAQYPKKRSKGRAERVWAKIKPDEQLFKAILDGLDRAKTSVEWQKDGGQYIPYPSTWLNAKGWEDEYNPPEQEGDRPRVDPALLEEYVRTATIHFGMKLEEFMDEGLSFEEAFFEIQQIEYMPELPEIKQRALENIKKIRLAG